LDIHAVTDVTGFGLLGHLREMCLASDVSAEINFRNLDFLKGVRELAEAGVVPGGTKRNLDFVKDAVIFDNKLSEVEQLLTADAQTSGGLLIAMPEKSVPDYINNMDPDYFYKPVQIGMITNKTVYLISVN
jgi:selenide,water dikinase